MSYSYVSARRGMLEEVQRCYDRVEWGQVSKRLPPYCRIMFVLEQEHAVECRTLFYPSDMGRNILHEIAKLCCDQRPHSSACFISENILIEPVLSGRKPDSRDSADRMQGVHTEARTNLSDSQVVPGQGPARPSTRRRSICA